MTSGAVAGSDLRVSTLVTVCDTVVTETEKMVEREALWGAGGKLAVMASWELSNDIVEEVTDTVSVTFLVTVEFTCLVLVTSAVECEVAEPRILVTVESPGDLAETEDE